MTEYFAWTTEKTLVRAGHPIFDELATIVRVTDEAGGPFIEVEQFVDAKCTIRIDIAEWHELRFVIDEMIEVAKRMGASLPANPNKEAFDGPTNS